MNYGHSFHQYWFSLHRIGKLIILLTLCIWVLNVQGVTGTASYDLYFPFIGNGRQFCGQEHLVNGNFEQDDYGWQLSSNGWGWKIHDLIGSKDEGFSPFNGIYAARLGGYEGVWDYIEQTAVIPENGQLNYWWRMYTHETLPFADWFSVQLLETDHTWVASLESHNGHDSEFIWQQDVIDLTEYAGRTLILRFSVSNDNYYFSWSDLDDIHLCSRLE